MSNTRRVQGKGSGNWKGRISSIASFLVAVVIVSFGAMLVAPAAGTAGEISITGNFENITGQFLGQVPTRGGVPGFYSAPNEDNELASFRNTLNLEMDIQDDAGVWSGFVKIQAIRELDHYDFSKPSGGVANVQDNFFTGIDLQDAFVTYRGSDNWTLNVGRQIVTWGESFVYRVNDVINPQDLTDGFFFEDLENTRMPIFMVRSVHTNFTPLNLYTEFIWAPGIDPAFIHTEHKDNRYQAKTDVAGRVNILPPPGTRFAPNLANGASAAGFFLPGFLNVGANNQIPEPSDGMQYGVRVLKQLGRWQVGGQIWHSHQYNPVFDQDPGGPSVARVPLGGGAFSAPLAMTYPEETRYGLSLSGALPSDWTFGLPMVLRTEVNHIPDKLSTPTPGVLLAPGGGAVESDQTEAMLGLDVSQLPITRSAQLNLTYEVYSDFREDNALLGVDHVERSHTFVIDPTGFDYGTHDPALTFIYDETPQNLATIASYTWNPSWTANYSFTLQYVGFSSDTPGSLRGLGLGAFDNKDSLFFIFNWSLPEATRTF